MIIFNIPVHSVPTYVHAPPFDTFYNSQNTVHMPRLYSRNSPRCIVVMHVVVLLFKIYIRNFVVVVVRRDIIGLHDVYV